jgi:hypothetical protein
MLSALELLRKYASTFRKMINSQVWKNSASIKQLLKLTKDSDWDFLTAAMDIIDDASAAIAHIERFGLSGPTKYGDIGERYLRLYGLLSATYGQQQSTLTIYKMMNVPNPTKIKDAFERLKIRELRHKLSAHGTEYLTADDSKEAYVPLRLNLGDTEVTSVRYSSEMHQETIDLTEAVNDHTTLMIEVMDEIIEKSIGTLFKGDIKRQEQFTQDLADLRIEKTGGLVIKGPEGAPKVIVIVAGAS